MWFNDEIKLVERKDIKISKDNYLDRFANPGIDAKGMGKRIFEGMEERGLVRVLDQGQAEGMKVDGQDLI